MKERKTYRVVLEPPSPPISFRKSIIADAVGKVVLKNSSVTGHYKIMRVPSSVEKKAITTKIVIDASPSIKPGAAAPRTGQYDIVGPRGGATSHERTVVKGQPLPPTPKAGQVYMISHSKSSKGVCSGKKSK